MVNFELVKTLWFNIEKLQLSYLQTEDSPQRIEQKKKFEGCLKEYLSLVPSSERFCFRETKNTLHTSLLHKGNQLSLSKFTQAWDVLSVFASNLLSQPWRKEFREIRLYSGGYKHQVEQQLIGAEQILMLMGYTMDAPYNRLVMQGVLDPDRIMLVFRDCMLAKVEAQILGEIYGTLNAQSGQFMWPAIIEYREQYFGTSSECIKGLLYQQQMKETVMYAYAVDHPSYMRPQKVYCSYPYPMTYSSAPGYPYCVSKENYGTYLPQVLPIEDSLKPGKQSSQDVRKANIPAFEGNFDIDFLEKMCNDESDSIRPASEALIEMGVNNHGTRSEDVKRITNRQISGIAKDDIKQGKNTVTKDHKMLCLNKKLTELQPDARADGWECTSCTFANREDREVCEMCFKSRSKGPEAHPLLKGGKECSKCTLVNPRETPYCRVCGATLEDAPTYI